MAQVQQLLESQKTVTKLHAQNPAGRPAVQICKPMDGVARVRL